jgi:putative thioredoxin
MADFNEQKFRGAFDLSVLATKNESANAGLTSSSPMQEGIVAEAAEPSSFKVPGLVLECNETNLRNFLTISNSVPVVVDFYSLRNEGSVSLTSKLVRFVSDLAGRVLLIRVDVDQQPKVAEAFKITNAPTFVAIFRGQPVPVFQGDQTDDQLKDVFEQLLKVAGENGISSVVTVEGGAMDADETMYAALPARHQAAFDAINAGNYDLAVREYEQALNESPGDTMATKGLAQVRLLQRTDSIDFEAVLGSKATNLAENLAQADALVAVGEFSTGFKVLLDAFALATTDREEIRKHLLELFLVVGNDDGAVTSARSRLAGLLY